MRIDHKLKNMSENGNQEQEQDQDHIAETDLTKDMNEDDQHEEDQDHDQHEEDQDHNNSDAMDTTPAHSHSTSSTNQDNNNNERHNNTAPMQTTPTHSQSAPQAMSIEEENFFLIDMNNELQQEIAQLQAQLEKSKTNQTQLQAQLEQSKTNQTITPQKKPPADSIYRNLINSPPASTNLTSSTSASTSSSSSSSSSTSEAIGDIQQYQEQVASDFEQELQNARNNLQNADNERYELARCVENFMQTNSSLWHIFMDLTRMITSLPSTPQIQLARNHIGLLQVSSSYIYIRMQVDQIHANMKTISNTLNMDFHTHQVPLMKNVIQNVKSIYEILKDFTNGSILPDLPRALKLRNLYVKELSVICEKAIANPQVLTTLGEAMRKLTKAMGENLRAFQQRR